MALWLFYTYLLVIDGDDIYKYDLGTEMGMGNTEWLPFICMNSPFILIAYNSNRFVLDVFLYGFIAFTFLLSLLDTPIPRCLIFFKVIGCLAFLLQIKQNIDTDSRTT